MFHVPGFSITYKRHINAINDHFIQAQLREWFGLWTGLHNLFVLKVSWEKHGKHPRFSYFVLDLTVKCVSKASLKYFWTLVLSGSSLLFSLGLNKHLDCSRVSKALWQIQSEIFLWYLWFFSLILFVFSTVLLRWIWPSYLGLLVEIIGLKKVI